MKIGERVGAISHSDNENTYLLGFGIYEGRKVPSKEVGGFNSGTPNPCIKLDDGKEVFGCECWWGPEEKMKEMIKDKNIIKVDIEELRKEAND